MRNLLLSLVACVLLTWSAAAQGPANPADAIVAAAREALGGTGRLTSITSFMATGRTRQVQGDNLVPIEFEIACEWPDKCYRRDEIPARESGPTTTGFNGDDLIQVPVPALPVAPGNRPGGAAPNPEAQRAARVNTAKQDFARLTLGLFVGTVPAFPVTFTASGEAEAPQGKADILDVKGPNGFAARLFLFRETRLPIMLTWQAPVPPGRSGRPGGPPGGVPAAAGASAAPGGGGPAAAGAGAAPAGPALVENRLYFADYRDADGFMLPFRLRRAVGPDTVEETTFDRFRMNVKIDARRFEVRR